MIRTCTRCGDGAETEEQLDEKFYYVTKQAKRPRHRPLCKACDKQRAKDWRRDNPAKWKQIHQRSERKRKGEGDGGESPG